MSALAVFAAAGAVTWLLRVAFVAILPADRLPGLVRRGLRYAGPASFAALLAIALTGGHAEPLTEGWRPIVAAIVTGVVAWRTRKLVLAVGGGVTAIGLLSLI